MKRFRFRPVVLCDKKPKSNPTNARGTIAQYAQPKRGMKAIIPKKKAKTPINIEIRFSIGISTCISPSEVVAELYSVEFCASNIRNALE